MVGYGVHYLGGDLAAWWKLTRTEQVQLLAWAAIRNGPKKDARRGPDRDPTPRELEALRARALNRRVR